MWNTTMGAVAAEYAFNERGWKTAYVVTDQFIAYTKSLSKYFIEHFKAIGGTVILEDSYTNGDNDFSAQLARLQALGTKPDVIYISSYGTDIAVMIRALREVGYDAPVLGGDSYDDPAIFTASAISMMVSQPVATNEVSGSSPYMSRYSSMNFGMSGCPSGPIQVWVTK